MSDSIQTLLSTLTLEEIASALAELIKRKLGEVEDDDAVRKAYTSLDNKQRVEFAQLVLDNGMMWRPFSTALENDAKYPFLLLGWAGEHDHTMIVFWNARLGCWYTDDGVRIAGYQHRGPDSPTHWMPLPAPPTL